jgi:hypothetical protein
MGTELVFSGGHRVLVVGTNAEGLIQNLNRASRGEQIQPAGSAAPLAEGWVDVQTETEGVILVNPSQVAYVRDVPDQESVLDQAL